jgi:hypothetical protein
MGYDPNVALMQKQLQLAGQNWLPVTGVIDVNTRKAIASINTAKGFGKGVGVSSGNSQLLAYLNKLQPKTSEIQGAGIPAVNPVSGQTTGGNAPGGVDMGQYAVDPVGAMADSNANPFMYLPMQSTGGGLSNIGGMSLSDIMGLVFAMIIINGVFGLFRRR